MTYEGKTNSDYSLSAAEKPCACANNRPEDWFSLVEPPEHPKTFGPGGNE
jgi:hypothetical protein